MTKREETSVLAFPHWLVIFLAIAVPTSLIPFLIGFVFGLSVAQDFVFDNWPWANKAHLTFKDIP